MNYKLLCLSTFAFALSGFSLEARSSSIMVTPTKTAKVKTPKSNPPPTDPKRRLSMTMVRMDQVSRTLFESPQKKQLGLDHLALMATSLEIRINTSDSRLRKIAGNKAFTLELDGFSFENGKWELTEDKSGSGIPQLVADGTFAHAEQFIAEKYLNHKFKNLKKLKVLLFKLDELFNTEDKILNKIDITLNPAGKKSGKSYQTTEKEKRILVRLLFSMFNLNSGLFPKSDLSLRYVLRIHESLGDVNLDVLKSWEINNQAFNGRVRISDALADIFSDKTLLRVRMGRSVANSRVSALDGEKLDIFEKAVEEIHKEHPEDTSVQDLVRKLSGL